VNGTMIQGLFLPPFAMIKSQFGTDIVFNLLDICYADSCLCSLIELCCLSDCLTSESYAIEFAVMFFCLAIEYEFSYTDSIYRSIHKFT
jgi:hypothetical protein